MTHSTYRSFHFRYFLGALFIFVYSLTLPQLSFAMPLITTSNETNHIKYFGYYWGMDDLAQVSPHVNALFITNQYKASTLQDLAQRDIDDLNNLDSLKIGGILNISRVFWDIKDWELGNKNPLRSNWKQRWQEYLAIIHPHLHQTIALYPMDEPLVNVPIGDYTMVVEQIKQDINTPILMILSPAGLTNLLAYSDTFVPKDIDWLGFDEYRCWEVDCYKEISIPSKFQIVVNNAKRNPGRKVVIVPDANHKNENATIPSIQVQEVKAKRINDYHQLCKNEPLCVGIFPFLWKTIPNKVVGAKQMPIVRENLQRIGSTIKSSAHSSSDLNADGSINIFDYNILVAGYGTEYDIFDYNELVANYDK